MEFLITYNIFKGENMKGYCPSCEREIDETEYMQFESKCRDCFNKENIKTNGEHLLVGKNRGKDGIALS